MDKRLVSKLTRFTNTDRYDVIDIYVQEQWIAITVASESDAEQLSYDLENILQVHNYGVRVSWKDFSEFANDVEAYGDWKVVFLKDVDYKGRMKFSC